MKYRSGFNHPSARIEDETVRIIRALRERHGWSLPRISAHFGIPWKTVHNFCAFTTRSGAGEPTQGDFDTALKIHIAKIENHRLVLACTVSTMG